MGTLRPKAVIRELPPSPVAAGKRTKVIVVTTGMLTFISFWRASAVVLCDLASTAYYIGGIVEQAVGRSAPYFILAVMLFSYCVRAVYVESCSMFTRGGVYRVVKEAMGSTLAKVSVSALMFDYVLTGPISGVAAGQYITGLMNELLKVAHAGFIFPPDCTAAVFAVGATLYFWRQNIFGIDESSEKAMRIMQVTTVMAVVIIAWCGITLYYRGAHLPPFELKFSDTSLGWLANFTARKLGAFGILIAFGHSILAMSGEESLAQVNREIEAPKLPNLLRTGFVIFIYSLLLTGLISFFAVMIIPDSVRMASYSDDLIGGLAMFVVGPLWARIALRAFVVLVGFLILAGAVNTAIVGSVGVLTRVAEDGVMLDWFRHPHKRYGTNYRIVNLVAILQIATIALSRGDVYLLGEAYAFGVVWSFVFKSLSVLMLRYRSKYKQLWKMPPNLSFFRPAGQDFPLGLAATFLILLATAVVNIFTKQVATIWGISFTAALFVIFTISEKINGEVAHEYGEEPEKFNVDLVGDGEELDARKLAIDGRVRKLIAIRDPGNLVHLHRYLSERDDAELIALTVRTERGLASSEGAQPFTDEEGKLFSKVVKVCEDHGRRVTPLVVVSNDQIYAIASTALHLGVEEVVMGVSAKFSPDIQLESFAMHWGSIAADDHHVKVRVLSENRDIRAEM